MMIPTHNSNPLHWSIMSLIWAWKEMTIFFFLILLDFYMKQQEQQKFNDALTLDDIGQWQQLNTNILNPLHFRQSFAGNLLYFV